MHCNLNTKLFYISSVLISKVKAMADNTGREREEELFEIIRSPRRLDDLNETDDGSQYLNNTGEGDDMIFDCGDRIDEVMDYDGDEINDYDGEEINYYDGEENVDLDKTETGKVYLYKQASSDHHMF